MVSRIYISRDENHDAARLDGIVNVSDSIIKGYLGSPKDSPMVLGVNCDNAIWLFQFAGKIDKREFFYKTEKDDGFYAGEAYPCKIPLIHASVDVRSLVHLMENMKPDYGIRAHLKLTPL